jgi:hypothetical protein
VTRILGGDSHSHFSWIKDKNSLSAPFSLLLQTYKSGHIVATLLTCDNYDNQRSTSLSSLILNMLRDHSSHKILEFAS